MNNKMNDLFNRIEDSNEYKEYKKIGKIIEQDSSISALLQEIKDLQKEAALLEANDDVRYKEINNVIDDKVKELYNNKNYVKYLDEIKKFNEYMSLEK